MEQKEYLKPEIELLRADSSEIIAVSIIDGGQADGSEVLTKENVDWELWEEE